MPKLRPRFRPKSRLARWPISPSTPRRRAARGAYAGSTERALRADVTLFTAWCSDAGAAALPAMAATVAAFIDAMAALKAPATVRRYVSSIATFHRAAGLANPCETQAVKLALKRMHRERGRAQNALFAPEKYSIGLEKLRVELSRS